MKKTLTFLFLLSTILASGQKTFYLENGDKIKGVGERATLRFNKDVALSFPAEEAGFAETLIASLLPSIIDVGFKISSNLVEKNLKKYTDEFSSRNTYTDNQNYITSFEVVREMIPIGSPALTEAFKLSIVPVQIDENTFVFAVDSISTSMSGAKVKKQLPYNDYTIEIKLTYFAEDEKKEQSSSPMTVSLLNVGESIYETRDGNNYLYMTDKFPFNPDFSISEVSIKIIETNSGKIKAEKIKASYDSYSEDAKEGAKSILNFYLEKSKKSEDEENGEDEEDEEDSEVVGTDSE